MSSIFGSGAITLKDVCDAYGVASNMNALRGKNVYNDSGSLLYTVVSTGALDMNQFRGKYTTATGNMVTTNYYQMANDDDFFNVTLLYRILEFGINSDGKLISLRIEINTTGASTSDFRLFLKFNSETYELGVGLTTRLYNFSTPIAILEITLNAFPTYASGFASIKSTYKISNGLILTNVRYNMDQA